MPRLDDASFFMCRKQQILFNISQVLVEMVLLAVLQEERQQGGTGTGCQGSPGECCLCSCLAQCHCTDGCTGDRPVWPCMQARRGLNQHSVQTASAE